MAPPPSWRRISALHAALLHAEGSGAAVVPPLDGRKPTADVAAARLFVAWPELGAGVSFDGSDDPIAPYAVSGWDDARWQNELEDVSVYGLVVEGMARLIPNNHDAGTGFELFKGFYFSCPGRCELIGGKVIIITCPGERFRALFSIGGPLVPGEARLPCECVFVFLRCVRVHIHSY